MKAQANEDPIQNFLCSKDSGFRPAGSLTLRRSLSFIADKADKMQGQYTLPLNSDCANADASDALDKLQGKIRATFTKDSRFLKR
jgi:hypothetical protein